METRKIYAILLSLIIPLFAYGNEVNNPSMEGNFISQPPLGYVAEYWTGYRAGGYLEGYFDESFTAHDGTKSQEIYWNGWGWGDFGPDGIYQQITSLQPGASYRASVWFKFHFIAMIAMGWADGEITCSVGTDPNGGTDPNVVTNWGIVSDSTWGDTCYEGPWINVVSFFSPNATTATLFIKANGHGNAEEEGWECPEPPCPPQPAPWDAYCYIDDVNVQLIQIIQESTVSATTPIPANGAGYSEVTISVLDSNSNPIEGIPASKIDINCTGSGNFILGPDTPTDVNGQTTAKIASTVAETKTVSATVLGTVLSDTATIYFCESNYSKLRASDGAASDLFGHYVAIDGNVALVGANWDDDNGSKSGSAYIFRFYGSNWVQEAKLLASDGASNDYFGCPVAIDGNTALVGAYGNDDSGSSSGSAYIFRYDGSNWDQQAKLTAPDGAASDYFGYSVSISGDYAIVGAYGDDDNGSSSGSAYIFRYDGSSWVQQDKLLTSDGAPGDYFGVTVVIDGNIALVGADYDDDNGYNSGSAYIFTPNSIDPNNWEQQAKLTASDGAADDWFGRSVAVDGNIALIGAYGNDDNGSDSGSAYIFRHDGSTWVEQAKLLPSDGATDDYFGRSVAIDGNVALVGAYGDDHGSAYIFGFDGSSWTQKAKLIASDHLYGDSFGFSVAIDGSAAMVGAHGDDDNGSSSGSAYMYAFPALIGDLDSNRDVDFADFSILAGQWMELPGRPSADAAPCGGDCIIDFLDLAVLCDHWLE